MRRFFKPATGVAALAVTLLPFSVQANPTFNFIGLSSLSASQQADVTAAGAYWSSALTGTNTRFNIDVATSALSNGLLAETTAAPVVSTYSAFLTALGTQTKSANDTTAISTLTSAVVSGNVKLLINETSTSATTPYTTTVSAGSLQLNLTSANARVLGMTAPGTTNLQSADGTVSCGASTTCDAIIQIASNQTFDTSISDHNSNTIIAGQYDLVGIVEHEIEHALGFQSGITVLDANAGSPRIEAFYTTSSTNGVITPLDLFRCSAASNTAGDLFDFTATSSVKYFGLDRCASTAGDAAFSNGTVNTGGVNTAEADHWAQGTTFNSAAALMNPTPASGTALKPTTLDLRALDVIGYTLTSSSVPEPATALLGASWLLGLAVRRRCGGVRTK